MNAQGELGRLQFDNSRMEREIKGYGNQIPIGQLERQNQELFDEIEQLKEQLAQYKSRNVEFVSKEEKARVIIAEFLIHVADVTDRVKYVILFFKDTKGAYQMG